MPMARASKTMSLQSGAGGERVGFDKVRHTVAEAKVDAGDIAAAKSLVGGQGGFLRRRQVVWCNIGRALVTHALLPLALHFQAVNESSIAAERRRAHHANDLRRRVAHDAHGQLVPFDELFHEDRLTIGLEQFFNGAADR